MRGSCVSFTLYRFSSVRFSSAVSTWRDARAHAHAHMLLTGTTPQVHRCRPTRLELPLLLLPPSRGAKLEGQSKLQGVSQVAFLSVFAPTWCTGTKTCFVMLTNSSCSWNTCSSQLQSYGRKSVASRGRPGLFCCTAANMESRVPKQELRSSPANPQHMHWLSDADTRSP
jgi:hypothetical protein